MRRQGKDGEKNEPEAFEYILKEKATPKVCFGSGKRRETLSSRGTSKFEAEYLPERIKNISPALYHVRFPECNKSFSIYGRGGIAKGEPRFRDKVTWEPPPVGAYEEERWPFKPTCNRVPFNFSMPQRPICGDDIPGPGTYHIERSRKRHIRMDHSFGGRMWLHCPADIKCTLYNTDKCCLCQEQPEGDYWHYKDREFLCRDCMNHEKTKGRKIKRWHIEEFRRVRDCSFMHIHDFTLAAYLKIHPKDARKMMQREAYFSEYFG